MNKFVASVDATVYQNHSMNRIIHVLREMHVVNDLLCPVSMTDVGCHLKLVHQVLLGLWVEDSDSKFDQYTMYCWCLISGCESTT